MVIYDKYVFNSYKRRKYIKEISLNHKQDQDTHSFIPIQCCAWILKESNIQEKEKGATKWKKSKYMAWNYT